MGDQENQHQQTQEHQQEHKQKEHTSHKNSSIMATCYIPVTDSYMKPIIGSQGRTIKSIKTKYNVRIRTLEAKPEDGHLHPSVKITGNQENVEKAGKWVRSIIGNTYRKENGIAKKTHTPVAE